MFKHLFGIFALALLVVSCAETTTDPGTGNNNNNNNGSAAPGVGSSYTMTSFQSNATFDTVQRASTGTNTIVETGMSFAGRTNVYRTTTSLQAGFSGYGSYESDGDMSEWRPLFSLGTQSYAQTWVRMPIVSSGPYTYTFDTTIGAGPTAVIAKTTLTTRSLGAATVTALGKSMTVRKFETKQVMEWELAGMKNIQNITSVLYWSPEVGNTVRSEITTVSGTPGFEQTSYLVVLLENYVKK